MSEADEQIGRNAANFRGDMSQKELADKMRERGFKWSQATVWSVEKGERPVRLTEAQALSSILRVPMRALLSTDAEARASQALLEFQETEMALRDAVQKFLRFQMDLATTADTVADSLSDEDMQYYERMIKHSPELIVRESRLLWDMLPEAEAAEAAVERRREYAKHFSGSGHFRRILFESSDGEHKEEA